MRVPLSRVVCGRGALRIPKSQLWRLPPPLRTRHDFVSCQYAEYSTDSHQPNLQQEESSWAHQDASNGAEQAAPRLDSTRPQKSNHERNLTHREAFRRRDPETNMMVQEALGSPFVPKARQYPSKTSTTRFEESRTKLARVIVGHDVIRKTKHGRDPRTLEDIMGLMTAVVTDQSSGSNLAAMRVVLPPELQPSIENRKLDYVDIKTGLANKVRMSVDQQNPKDGLILRGQKTHLARVADELVAIHKDVKIFELGQVATFDYATRQLWPTIPCAADSDGKGSEDSLRADEDLVWLHKEPRKKPSLDVPYESVPKPGEGATREEFSEYIIKLLEIRHDPARIRELYPGVSDVTDPKKMMIVEAFRDPALRHCVTPAILNRALSWLMKAGGHRADGSELFNYAQRIGLPIDTDTYNIMLDGYECTSDVGHFYATLKAMTSHYHAPNTRTWIILLHLVRNEDERRQIIVRMWERGAFEDPSARRQVAAVMASYDLHQALKSGKSLEHFLKGQEQRYGKDWYTNEATLGLIDEYLSFSPNDGSQPSTLISMLDRPSDDGETSGVLREGHLLRLAARHKNWDLALLCLDRGFQLEQRPVRRTYQFLSRLAVATDARHTLALITWYGTLYNLIDHGTVRLLNQVLLRAHDVPRNMRVRAPYFLDEAAKNELHSSKVINPRFASVVFMGVIKQLYRYWEPALPLHGEVRRCYEQHDRPWQAKLSAARPGVVPVQDPIRIHLMPRDDLSKPPRDVILDHPFAPSAMTRRREKATTNHGWAPASGSRRASSTD